MMSSEWGAWSSLTRRGVLRVAGLSAASFLAACGTSVKTQRHAKPRRRLVHVDDFGARGDGSSDDYEAISRAIKSAGAGTVVFSPRRYAVSQSLSLGQASLEGVGKATLLKIGQAQAPLIAIPATANSVSVSALGLESIGSAPSLVAVSAGATEPHIESCHMRDPTGLSVGVSDAGSHNGQIDNCTFVNLTHSVLVHGSAADLAIEDCRFDQWRSRAIHVAGGDRGGVDGLAIRRNDVLSMGSPAFPRQPITIDGTADFPHRSVVVEDNTIVGPARAWDAPVNPGTADQIAIGHCANFAVRRNVSVHGGDMGITVAGSAARGIIEGNSCLYNDTAGIDIGSRNSGDLHGIVVRDNTCANNGQNRAGTRPATSRAGMLLQLGCVGTVVRENKFGDSQPRPTQLYAISIGTTRDVVVRDNLVPDGGGVQELTVEASAENLSTTRATRQDQSVLGSIKSVHVPRPAA